MTDCTDRDTTTLPSQGHTQGKALAVSANYPIDRDRLAPDKRRSVFLEITRPFEENAYIAVDADDLRKAIDKAVGPTEEPAPIKTPGLRNAIEVSASTKAYPADPEKPYRPVDRDRLLRHINDLEATLARRNARHEEDQERIRELERDLDEAEKDLDAAETKTAREYLDLAWETAYVPQGDEIPEHTPSITKYKGGDIGAWPVGSLYTLPVRGTWGERRLLDAPPTDAEKRRAEYEAAGLKDWEIELLMGSEEN